ncbi:MAG: SET domain-containing protein-lysine N-methyltransferase [Steroidobacteraceae bacterium]
MAIRKSKRSQKTSRRSTSRGKTTAATKAPKRAKRSVNGKRRSTVKKVAKPRDASKLDLIEVRDSPIHGRGVYARTDIKKGRRILEYVGDRISHREADRRFFEKPDDDGHTFLFIVDGRTVIDGGTGGNPSRFVNHSCDPNCETVIQDRRVFVETIRDIKAGEELGYDYQLTWESTDDVEDLALYTCRCGAKNCRGTMLDREPLDKKKGGKAAS